MMKKTLIMVLVLCLLAFGTACQTNVDPSSGSSPDNTEATKRTEPEKVIDTFGNTTNGIYLTSRLEIRDCILYDFDSSKYDGKEYKTLLEEELGEYNQAHPYTGNGSEKIDAITIEKCAVSKNVLTQILKYYDAADFLEYNKGELQKRSGSVLMTGTLLSPDNSLKSYEFVDPSGEAVDIASWTESNKAGNYRYMICDIKAVLYGEGKVVAYSKGAAYTADLNCVNSAGGKPVAVIFK